MDQLSLCSDKTQRKFPPTCSIGQLYRTFLHLLAYCFGLTAWYFNDALMFGFQKKQAHFCDCDITNIFKETLKSWSLLHFYLHLTKTIRLSCTNFVQCKKIFFCLFFFAHCFSFSVLSFLFPEAANILIKPTVSFLPITAWQGRHS